MFNWKVPVLEIFNSEAVDTELILSFQSKNEKEPKSKKTKRNHWRRQSPKVRKVFAN